MSATTLGTLGIAYADPVLAAVRRPLMIGGAASFAGYAVAASLAWAGDREKAAVAGMGASVIAAASMVPAYRATKSAFLLNGLVMSLASAGFYGYKRSHLDEA